MSSFRDGYTTGYTAGWKAAIETLRRDVKTVLDDKFLIHGTQIDTALFRELERRESERET